MPLSNQPFFIILFVLFYAVILWLTIRCPKAILKIIPVAVLLYLSVYIINAGSRTAILSVIVSSIYVTYPLVPEARRRLFLYFSITLSLFCVVLLAGFIKTDSTSGRWFIWQRAFDLWKENWLTGVGWRSYNPHFNHTQAAYFANHSLDNWEAMLANDGYYAFNEWFQVAIELGLTGLLLSLFITFIVIKACLKDVNTGKRWVGAMLIAIMTACLFSYPLHNPFILAITAFLTGYITKDSFGMSFKIPVVLKKLFIVSLCVLLVFFSLWYYKTQQLFKEARRAAKEGYKTEAIAICGNIAEEMKKDYSFTLYYLNLLYETNRLKEAIEWFSTFHPWHCNQRAHAVVARCYDESGQYKKAEEHLLLSLHITPHLLQSRIDLMEFYDRAGDLPKAKYWAAETFSYPIKVENPKAYYLKEVAKKYLESH